MYDDEAEKLDDAGRPGALRRWSRKTSTLLIAISAVVILALLSIGLLAIWKNS
jgi:putative exporter of polyketide antibiotics